MEQIEKTCENCKWDFEDMEGSHCRHCIHSAEERFEPKEKELSEMEIRNKAIEEFAERLKERFKGMQMAELQGEDVCPYAEEDCPYMYQDVSCQYCAREQTIKDIAEIAESMKGEKE